MNERDFFAVPVLLQHFLFLKHGIVVSNRRQDDVEVKTGNAFGPRDCAWESLVVLLCAYSFRRSACCLEHFSCNVYGYPSS